MSAPVLKSNPPKTRLLGLLFLPRNGVGWEGSCMCKYLTMNVNTEAAVLVRITRDRKRACEDRDWCCHKLEEAGKTIPEAFKESTHLDIVVLISELREKVFLLCKHLGYHLVCGRGPGKWYIWKHLSLQSWPGTTVSMRVGEKRLSVRCSHILILW